MLNVFYVYIYLDPRKPGNYIYGEYHFEYEPFYVGKGKGERFGDHIKEYNLRNDKLIKTKIIRKILNGGLTPIIVKLKCDLIEYDALILEKEIISLIGRIDLKTGPLTNLTNGGDINSGRHITDDFRVKQSNIMKEYYKLNPIPENVCSKISNILLSKNMTRSEETKRKISVKNKGHVMSNEQRMFLKNINSVPKLYKRNKIVLISPNNKIHCFIGKDSLHKFINENNLSASKFRDFNNKGVITDNNIRCVRKYGKIKTMYCVGWEIKTYKYNIGWNTISEELKKHEKFNTDWFKALNTITKYIK